MRDMKTLLDDAIGAHLIGMILSNKRFGAETLLKIKIRPVVIGDVLKYQVETFTQTQTFHQNLDQDAVIAKILDLYKENAYKQMDIYTVHHDYHLLINKKGGIHMTQVPATTVQQPLGHNRKKQYLLEEGQNIPFLIQLGIMTKEFKIVQKKYDKFRQINRYLEMVEDVIPYLNTAKQVRIVDFGCGKSYLTFALYHYLVSVKQYDVVIVGLDLKADVIAFCTDLSQKLGYSGLTFQVGDIGAYTDSTQVDMVITLHACDTATDLALQKAVGWGAQVIMSVPCCQHELNGQLACKPLEDVLKYGIIKERMAALITDAMRANWLELQGYEVQILEFIDLEHTPKNLLIRGVKSKNQLDASEGLENFKRLEAYLGADLTIKR